MMTLASSDSADIILDSGADTSALPLAYIDVGESCSHETIGQDCIDAQGGKLDIRDTRLATVDLGNGVVLRERFIIAKHQLSTLGAWPHHSSWLGTSAYKRWNLLGKE